MKQQTLDLNNLTDEIILTEDIEINATFIGRNDNEIKKKIFFTHKTPNIKSRINIKAVLYDSSRFDLEAVLKIEKGAVQTDTYLKINCLVVGDNAYARAIPSLEITESEVKGGHGATIGYLDPVQMNYLESKGLDEKQAEELLIEGFIAS